MTAEVRRKNNGKQFALAHIPSRVVFSWHRPGEPLPKLVEYLGETYKLTQAAVDEAQKNQRAPLEVFQGVESISPRYALPAVTWVNPKGGKESVLVDRWVKAKDLLTAAAVVVGAAGASWVIADNLKGIL